MAGRGIMFSTCQFVRPSVRPFVCYESCKHNILKTNETISMPAGINGLRGYGIKR